MAETAKVLNPTRTVVLPDLDAGCSLVDSCTAEQVRAFRERHPDHVIVSYVNTSVEVKAESDILCTSRNAVQHREFDSRGEADSVSARYQPGQLRQAADRPREHEDLAGRLHRARDVPGSPSGHRSRGASAGAGGGASRVPRGRSGDGGFHRIDQRDHRLVRVSAAPTNTS